MRENICTEQSNKGLIAKIYKVFIKLKIQNLFKIWKEEMYTLSEEDRENKP